MYNPIDILFSAESSLKSRIDDTFLLRFLRARRFDYDAAFQLICDYYSLRSSNRELLVPLDKLRPIFDSNLMAPALGWSREDEAVFLFRLGKWCPQECTFDEVIAAAMLSMEALIEEDANQISGIVVVVDMAGFAWSQLRKFGPSQAKKVMHIMEKCMPIRLKAIYVINESTLADIGFAIMRPFCVSDLNERIFFLGNDMQALHEYIEPEMLPREYGGVQGELDSSEWYRTLVAFDKSATRDSTQYGWTDEAQDSDANSDSLTGAGEGGKGGHRSLLVKCGMPIGVCGTSHTRNGFGPSGTDMRTLFRKSQTCNGYLFDYYNISTSTI